MNIMTTSGRLLRVRVTSADDNDSSISIQDVREIGEAIIAMADSLDEYNRNIELLKPFIEAAQVGDDSQT